MGYNLYDERFAVELPRSAKLQKRLDGAKSVRKLERGLRAQQFMAASAAGFDRSSSAPSASGLRDRSRAAPRTWAPTRRQRPRLTRPMFV